CLGVSPGYTAEPPQSREEALLLAVWRNEEEKVEALLAQGANPNFEGKHIKTGLGWTPLMAAVNSPALLKRLLDKGADINAATREGKHVLTLAVQIANNSEAVQLLLDRGADVGVKDSPGDTALILAAQRGDTDYVQRLLAHKADVNAAG